MQLKIRQRATDHTVTLLMTHAHITHRGLMAGYTVNRYTVWVKTTLLLAVADLTRADLGREFTVFS